MRIKYIPNQPLSLTYGGFEIQMTSAERALSCSEVDISPLQPTELESNYDILHFWGCDYFHRHSIDLAYRNQKRIVVSGLFPYYSLKSHARYFASLYLGTARTRKPMLEKVSAFTVVNDEQALYLRKVLNIRKELIHVVPNIIDDEFFFGAEATNVPLTKLENYLITCGTICKRKNQLNLARACADLNLPLLIIGNTAPSEVKYAEELEYFIKNNEGIEWIPGLPYASKELISCYHKSIAFCLVSHSETQPIAALEALACRKPCLLSNHPFSKSEPFQSSISVNPNSIPDIKKGILLLLDSGPSPIKIEELKSIYGADAVSRKYKSIYKQIL